jgi:hypothetical protein
MSNSSSGQIGRCLQKIAEIESLILGGHPDSAGLCLALSDWSAELRILESETHAKSSATH